MSQKDPHYAGEFEIAPDAAEPKDLAAGIGARIAKLRERQGWDRVELAQRLGVQRDRLGKWELGKSLPPLDMLLRLAQALGVTLDELILGEPTVQKPLTSQQCKDLELLLEAAQKVLREPGSVFPRLNA